MPFAAVAATADRFEGHEALRLARTLARQGSPARAYTMALALHDFAQRQGDDLLGADTADCLAYCSMMTTQYEPGIRFAHVARRTWHERGRVADEATVTGVLAMLLAWIGEPEAVTWAEAAMDLAERSHDVAATVWALQAKCLVSVLLKQPETGLPFGEHAVALSRTHDLGSLWSYVGLSEAIVWSTARPVGGAGPPVPLPAGVARALELTREALDSARRQGDGWMERLLLCNIAEYSLYIGDTASADAALEESADTPGDPTDRCRALHLLMRGRSLAASQCHGPALQAFTESFALMSTDNLELASMCQSDMSETLARLGRFEEALAAHRSFHALHVRRASEAADRRARLYAAKWETEELRAAAAQAQAQAQNLTASNELLSREAERLLRTSLEDPLTGLSNRRHLDVALLEVLASGVPYALAMIDVDRFKQVNDRFSHLVGDAVLRSIATLLKVGSRSEDLIVRYGGEEFAALLRDTDQRTAATICERLREMVATHAWSTLGDGLAVTISIGVSTSHEAASHEGVLAVADRRLYRAKQEGRNQVCVRG